MRLPLKSAPGLRGEPVNSVFSRLGILMSDAGCSNVGREREHEHAVLRGLGDHVLTLRGDSTGQLAALGLAHRLALFAHANHGHRVQTREQCAISELNVMCQGSDADVAEL